jgi:hypothetical protein
MLGHMRFEAVDRPTGDLLDNFQITNHSVVFAADIIRWLGLGLTLALAALYLRALFGVGVSRAVARYPGFATRTVGLMCGLLFAGLTEYDEIGEPVTALLPLFLGALGCAAWSLRSLPSPHSDERVHWEPPER